MRNNEDYLDSLLNNVTQRLSEFDEDFEKKKQDAASGQARKSLPPKTSKAMEAVRENQFLREYEQEFRQDDPDSFLRQFEAELDQEVEDYERSRQGERDGYMDRLGDLLGDGQASDPDDASQGIGASGTSANSAGTASEGFDGPGAPGADISITASPADSGQNMDDVMLDGDFADELGAMGEADPFAGLGADSAGASSGGASNPDWTDPDAPDAPPEGMEALEGLFGEDGADGKGSDDDEERILPEDGEGLDDDGIMNILNGMSEDEELSDIGKMLEADEQSLTLEDLASNPENLEQAADVAEAAREPGEEKKKKKKNGFFSKLMDLLFGEDDDDDEAPVKVSEAGDLENITDENMEILRAMEGDKLTEPAKKKGKKKKEKKPKEKKEKKEKKPKEPKPPKEKKEKKPKEKGPREKPLPKGPVIAIWILAASIFALIFISSNLLGRSSAVSEAQQAFDKGDYVASYAALRGVKVSGSDGELYERAKVLAGVQTELDAYYSMMDVRKFDLALDCLVRALGRSKLHEAEAEEWGVTSQMDAIADEVLMHLQDQFDVTEEQADELYDIGDRDEYSLAIDEILTNLGLK